MSRKHTGYGKKGLLSPTISKLGRQPPCFTTAANLSRIVLHEQKRKSSTGLHSLLPYIFPCSAMSPQVFTGTANIVYLFCHLTPKTDFSQNEVFTQVRYFRLPSTLATEAATEGGGVGFGPGANSRTPGLIPSLKIRVLYYSQLSSWIFLHLGGKTIGSRPDFHAELLICCVCD